MVKGAGFEEIEGVDRDTSRGGRWEELIWLQWMLGLMILDILFFLLRIGRD
jgi:hypothetical protein